MYNLCFVEHEKSRISNERRYGQNAIWVSGLKQHASILWNFSKRYWNTDSTPLAHSCAGLSRHTAHEQFWLEGVGKTAHGREVTTYISENQNEFGLVQLEVGAIGFVWSHSNSMQILDKERRKFPRLTLLLLRKAVVAPLTRAMLVTAENTWDDV